jgi:hypothetical protein
MHTSNSWGMYMQQLQYQYLLMAALHFKQELLLPMTMLSFYSAKGAALK